ncbi:hypothetical protein [Methanoplanus limicola]|uniref:Uncharacterized protein n=1 Tax=Methanoplanus limicola DSM 2279 TaxID=937775 RepID=H1Z1C1_9EURY|nr:hypothetical protein [Methanoplanus limicola]EHQ35388.1 hypothetical protein Metlim_1279 [Methanoplanus limicola DSM 2279]
MRREKFISGGLEGAGVEGKNKNKLSSKERHDSEGKDPMDTGFGHTGKPQVKKSSGSRINSEDPFYTGFGESRQEKKGYYSERSAKERSSDIFSDGFGSKEISGGRSAGERRKSGSFEEENVEAGRDFSDDVHTVSTSGPGRKKKSPEDDPFYTGFGYTNQREDDNVRHSENEPLKREDLPEIPEKSAHKEVKEEINFIRRDDEIFEDISPEKGFLEDESRDYISEETEMSEPENKAENSPLSERGYTEESVHEKKVKKSSIFDRDDDDLFSV